MSTDFNFLATLKVKTIKINSHKIHTAASSCGNVTYKNWIWLPAEQLN